MFKLAHEFTFQAVHTVQPQFVTKSCPAETHAHSFTGQLVFKGTDVGQFGTLCTEEELQKYSEILNSMNKLADIWSLELIAKELYNYGVALFPNLYGIVLYLTDAPFRVAEYTQEQPITTYETELTDIDNSPAN